MILLGPAGASAPAGPAPPGPVALRVMPMGDSITFGTGSSTGAGYRTGMRELLVAGGRPADLVGDRRSGTGPDPDHEGVPGAVIAEIAARSRVSVPFHRPDVVTLHAGTNDLNRDVDPAGAPARLGALIDRILAGSPGVTVLVATLVPARSPATQARIGRYNEQVMRLAEGRRRAGQRVRPVSMAGVTPADLADALHPSDAGYRTMAAAFHAAIEQSIADGWLTRPTTGARGRPA